MNPVSLLGLRPPEKVRYMGARSAGRRVCRQMTPWEHAIPVILGFGGCFGRGPSGLASRGLVQSEWVGVAAGFSAVAAGLGVAEQLSGLLPRKLPVDFGALTVRLAVPGPRFSLQCAQVRYPPFAQALPGIQAQFDLGLVQPTSVFRGVVDGEPVPETSASPLAKAVRPATCGNGY